MFALAAGRGEAEEVAWKVPPGLRMTRPTPGPAGITIAFLTPDLWCAADARREIVESLRIATFGPDGRLLGEAKAAGIEDLDLGDRILTSLSLAADDGIDIEGTFTSVRGQPRPGQARLRPDGSLDD